MDMRIGKKHKYRLERTMRRKEALELTAHVVVFSILVIMSIIVVLKCLGGN